MFTIYVRFECLPGKREAFLQKMLSSGVLAAIRAEEGCLSYEYYLSHERENELLLIEIWRNKEDQAVHMTLEHMAELGKFKDDYIAKTTLGEFILPAKV